MSSGPSPNDTDRASSESMSTTAASSVTSEPPPAYAVSPALKPVEPDTPVSTKFKVDGADDKLASRELEAPVPSDFPGKKPRRSAHIVAKGDFESANHFYPRCCKFPSLFPSPALY